jgi:hypothetical protein
MTNTLIANLIFWTYYLPQYPTLYIYIYIYKNAVVNAFHCLTLALNSNVPSFKVLNGVSFNECIDILLQITC